MKFKKIKFKKVKSTNNTAIRIIKNSSLKCGMVISDTQTMGRGQYGKKWISYKGNLFVSFFYNLENLSLSISQLTLINCILVKKLLSIYYKNRILFGDGSTSTLISKEKDINSFQIGNFIYGTDGSGHKNAIIDNFGSRHWLSKKKGGETLDLNGPEIYKFALQRVPEAIYEFLNKNNLKINEIDYFVFHQANEFINKSIQRLLKIPDKKIFNQMQFTGNTSSSSIPIVLSNNFSRLSKGKNILLAGFGGGLSWGVCLIKK